MAVSQLILVDTSVWIHFLRFSKSREASILDGLLSLDYVVICGPIYAEILSGASQEKDWQKLFDLLKTLTFLEPPEDIWLRIARARFSLFKNGLAVSLVDLWIAITAQFHQVSLWTLDRDFEKIKNVVHLHFFPAPLNLRTPT